LAERIDFIRDSPSLVAASRARQRRTVDMARRLLFIKPDQVRLSRGPTSRVQAVFNPGMEVRGDTAIIYPRFVVGYYLYVSGIGRIEIPLSSILSGEAPRELAVDPVILPDLWIDFWGAEDPRLSTAFDRKFLTYTGRTVNYYQESSIVGKTVPVVAEEVGGSWVKRGYISFPERYLLLVRSDKNAFIVDMDGEYVVFHRPHEVSGRFSLSVGRIGKVPDVPGITAITLKETWRLMEPASHEEKLGWSAPITRIKRDSYLVLLHSVDSWDLAYRVSAAIIRYPRSEPPVIESVTPFYIMEPSTIEERYGDRPMVVYPCGAIVVDDEVIIAYGAGDMAIGLASIDLSRLLEVLDNNRIE